MLIAFNKPFGVLCQFSGEGHTLSDFGLPPDIYPAGRLDKDSEGLLLLTDDGRLQARIANPKFNKPKTYWAQVEGIPDQSALEQLRNGVTLKDGPTRRAGVDTMDEPADLWPRNPPIRVRKSVPDSWVEMRLTQGRNRQVRRMTAHVGFPTLRLIRFGIGKINLRGLDLGHWVEVDPNKL